MSQEKSNALFNDVIGQKIAVSILSNTLKCNRIAPAYLFTGPVGVGKNLATIRFLEGIITGGDPISRERKRVEGLNHPDIIWIEPSYLHQGKLIPQSIANKTSINRKTLPQIRLEQIRGIKKFLSNQPLEAKLNMAVIKNAERMNEAAANALLKTLEEPGNGLLILISERPESLLPTINSRCQTIPFTKLTSNDLEKIFSRIQLNQKIDLSIGFNEEELLKLANGSPGALIANINTWQEFPEELLARLKRFPKKPIEALSLARDLTEAADGEQQVWLINWLQQYIWGQTLDSKAIKILEDLRSHLLSFVQPRLAWEVALLRLSQIEIQALAGSGSS